MLEFNRNVLESLREPLESGQVTISRAGYQAIFPARFQFIAAMNPCPCGFWGSTHRTCRCSPQQIQRYLAKLSGPLLDRIDMQIEVSAMPSELLSARAVDNHERSVVVKERVICAQQRQIERQGKYNQELSADDLQQHGILDSEAQKQINQIMNKFNLSARVYHRIVKVSRTIADLVGHDIVTAPHVSEAFSYRSLDRSRFMIEAFI